MRLFLLSLILLLTSQANAFEMCATGEVDTSEKFFIDLKTKLVSSAPRFMSTESFKPKVIPVVFHVIQKKVADDVIRKQIDVLNDGYALTGFSFELKNINFVNSKRWASADLFPMTRLEYDMKSQLRQGGSDTLNVYIVPTLNIQLGGWAYFPWQYRAQPELDGVVIATNSLPGGDSPISKEGIVLIHETGHWMGLLHTFQGECSAEGDMIDDTPAQAAPILGCSLPVDSCPNDPGLDPTKNFMGYSGDGCMSEFTPGQIERMTTVFQTFRKSISTLIN